MNETRRTGELLRWLSAAEQSKQLPRRGSVYPDRAVCLACPTHPDWESLEPWSATTTTHHHTASVSRDNVTNSDYTARELSHTVQTFTGADYNVHILDNTASVSYNNNMWPSHTARELSCSINLQNCWLQCSRTGNVTCYLTCTCCIRQPAYSKQCGFLVESATRSLPALRSLLLDHYQRWGVCCETTTSLEESVTRSLPALRSLLRDHYQPWWRGLTGSEPVCNKTTCNYVKRLSCRTLRKIKQLAGTWQMTVKMGFTPDYTSQTDKEEHSWLRIDWLKSLTESEQLFLITRSTHDTDYKLHKESRTSSPVIMLTIKQIKQSNKNMHVHHASWILMNQEMMGWQWLASAGPRANHLHLAPDK